MHETEFSEALGRLLTDGQLRDDFAVDPDGVVSKLCEDALVRAELVLLKMEDLEVQAEVLLRKRFEVVKRFLPGLITRLETKAWPAFRQYARNQWASAPQDALGFAEYAGKEDSSKVDPSEMNRLRFAVQSNSLLKIHWIIIKPSHPALQILMRIEKERWREWVLYLRF